MTTRRQALAILVSAPSAGWVNAATLDQASIQALEARIAEYEALMLSGEIASVLDFLPPPLLKEIARRGGMDVSEFRGKVATLFDGLSKDSDFGEIEFSFGLVDAVFETSHTGRALAIMHSTLVMPGMGETQTPIVALVEAETWYLVRIESPMHEILLGDVYPDLADVNLWR